MSQGLSEKNSEEEKASIISLAKAIISVADGVEEKSKNRRWYQKVKWLELIGFLFVVVQTGIFWQQCSISRAQSAYAVKRDSIMDIQTGDIEYIRETQAESLKVFSSRQAAAAERSLKLTLNTDRPWLSIKRSKLIIKDTPSVLAVHISFENSGKSPAVDVNIGGCISTFPKRAVFMRDTGGCAKTRPSTSIMAGVTDTINLEYPIEISKADEIATNAAGKYFYIFGTVTYRRDRMEKNVYGLRYCRYYVPKDSVWMDCEMDSLNDVW